MNDSREEFIKDTSLRLKMVLEYYDNEGKPKEFSYEGVLLKWAKFLEAENAELKREIGIANQGLEVCGEKIDDLIDSRKYLEKENAELKKKHNEAIKKIEDEIEESTMNYNRGLTRALEIILKGKDGG